MDYQIFQWLHSLADQHWLTDWLFIFLADYLGYVLLVAAVALIFWRIKSSRQRLYYLLLGALSFLVARGLIVEAVRFFYQRPRPFKVLAFEPLVDQLTSNSMPSGHAALFFALAVVTYFIDRKYFWYFLLGALLIAISRVVVGLHWPSDVLVGALLGTLTAVIIGRFISSPIISSNR